MNFLFDAKSHFDFLKFKVEGAEARRGIKSRLAEHIRVQPAYLSQVLSRKHPLSLEQADLLNQFFSHTEEEAEFFLLLVSRDRAGTSTLKKHFDRQIEGALAKRMQVVRRLGPKRELGEEAKGVYYSSWIYPTLHLACTIVGLSTRQALAQHFSLLPQTVAIVLEFLEENGLVIRDGDSYRASEESVRLDKKSPHIVKHHSNWRLKAIQNLERQSSDDLHYSGLFSIDLETMRALKDQMLEFVKDQIKIVERAKEEELVVLGIDIFRLSQKNLS